MPVYSHSSPAGRIAACQCGHFKCNLLLAQARLRMIQHLSSNTQVYITRLQIIISTCNYFQNLIPAYLTWSTLSGLFSQSDSCWDLSSGFPRYLITRALRPLLLTLGSHDTPSSPTFEASLGGGSCWGVSRGDL